MISSLPAPVSIEQNLGGVHEALKSELPSITRMAVAVYDRKSDLLKTFVNSTEGSSPLTHYEARLSDVPSLAELARSGQSRVIDDLSVLKDAASPHSKAVVGRYASSFTKPLFEDGRLRGFLFFDSTERSYFSNGVVQRLDIYSSLVSMMLVMSLVPLRMLRSVVQVTTDVTHSRDPETGAHLERMARYARAIALELAAESNLDDSFVEYLFLFAPLHDVGKVGIPDEVLLKKGRLTEGEFAEMKKHVTKGAALVERVLEDAGFGDLPSVTILKNVVLHHHEAWDGSGYPHGLSGTDIPVEARIVQVADVYDALTSHRPYKEAWTPDRALTYLRNGAGRVFDPKCVEALDACHTRIEEIRARFRDEDTLVLREGYNRDW